MNVKTREDHLTVLKLLLEGNSISSVSRLTGIHRDTCSRILVMFGQKCRSFLNREMRDLTLRHVQIDEIWTFVKKKEWRVEDDDPDRDKIGRIVIYVALDEDTKLIPAHRVGRLCDETTQIFMADLSRRIKKPRPRRPDYLDGYVLGEIKPILRISTDGNLGYKKSIEAHFGPFAEYARIKKKVTGLGKKRRWNIKKKSIFGTVPLDLVSTSLVERSNLTMRTFMRQMMRKTLGFSKKFENLEAATAAYMTHYNYCWKHKTLGTSPAYAAGLAPKRFTLAELYDHVSLCLPWDA